MEDVRKLVAIRYPSDAECPFISLKAKGHLAEKLLDIVAENEIPVVEDAFLSGILPFVKELSGGTRTIILTVLISSVLALLKPLKDGKKT